MVDDGGKDDAAELSRLIDSVKGASKPRKSLGSTPRKVGKPHCDPLVDSRGRVVGAIPIATITGYDNRLVFLQSTPKLAVVLTTLGLEYANVETLSVEQFKAAFKAMPVKFPGCVHTVLFKEATRLVDARDAVRPFFRLSIQKVSGTATQ